jgi:hypothetical protein
MNLAMLALTLALSAPPDTFAIQADLQGLYDEISQATLQFVTPGDADQFHDVVFTPDWYMVDASGRHSWAEIRERLLHAPPPLAATQPIQKVSLVPGGAMTTVKEIRTRGIVDADGKYGKKGAPHTLTDTTLFKDSWVKVGDNWKFKSREQVGPTKTQVDVSDYTQ